MSRDFVIHEWADPGGTGEEWIAPFHVHHADDEAWHVLEGRLRFRLGDEIVDAPAGTTIVAERGTPHTYGNPFSEPARYLIVLTPRIDRLVERVHEPSSGDLRALFREHESDLVP